MPELRKDPLMGRWVIISSERAKRPDQYASHAQDHPPQPDCPFCPGNEQRVPPPILEIKTKRGQTPSEEALSRERRGLTPNWSIRVVPPVNPVLRRESHFEETQQGIFQIAAGVGAHEVIVETPEHHRSLGQLSVDQIRQVLDVYDQRLSDLREDPRFKYLLLFKNHGRQAGGGRFHHAHSQIIAMPVTPARVKDELDGAKEQFKATARCSFCSMIESERKQGDRILFENKHFIALLPYASRFPFELWILPKFHAADFMGMSAVQKDALAQTLQKTLWKMYFCLQDPPYNYILHTAPLRRARAGFPDYWSTIDQDFHWHIELIPTLTRVAGFEWGTGFYINPMPPEAANQALKACASPEGPHG